MNKYIKEIANQAMFHACRELGNRKNWHQSYQEKFAELLILECAELMEEQHTWMTNVSASNTIRTHFGIK